MTSEKYPESENYPNGHKKGNSRVDIGEIPTDELVNRRDEARKEGDKHKEEAIQKEINDRFTEGSSTASGNEFGFDEKGNFSNDKFKDDLKNSSEDPDAYDPGNMPDWWYNTEEGKNASGIGGDPDDAFFQDDMIVDVEPPTGTIEDVLEETANAAKRPGGGSLVDSSSNNSNPVHSDSGHSSGSSSSPSGPTAEEIEAEKKRQEEERKRKEEERRRKEAERKERERREKFPQNAIDAFTNKYSSSLNGFSSVNSNRIKENEGPRVYVSSSSTGPMENNGRIAQRARQNIMSVRGGEGVDLNKLQADPNSVISSPGQQNSVVGTSVGNPTVGQQTIGGGSFDNASSYAKDTFTDNGFARRNENIGLAPEGSANYETDKWNQGMEQNANTVVSDKNMKVFRKNCYRDPVFKNAVKLIVKRI